MHGVPVSVRLPVLWQRLGSLAWRRPRRMSWTCHGRSNSELVDKLQAAKLVQDPRSLEAMRAVDRGRFCGNEEAAYIDAPQSIGYGATISAPHMHATCLELLKDHLRPGNKALDIGSGSGYLTAIFAHLVGSGGRAIGVEHIPELSERAAAAAGAVPFAAAAISDGSLRFVTGDGMQGSSDDAPFDAIHVGASAAEIPEALLAQLARGGRMVVPVGGVGERQALLVVDRGSDGGLSRRELMGVQYVPLTSREKQLKGAAGRKPVLTL